jgi:coenzyme F420 hydrogenase subunit delta
MQQMDTKQPLDLELMPAFCQARVLVLGVGNVLFGDDGFGPAVIDSLFQHYDIPDDVYVMDVGTGVRKLLFTLILGDTHPEEIVIVDAVDWGFLIGEVKEIAADELPMTKIDDFSLHQVPTSNMLRELQDLCEVKVSVVVCDIGNLPQKIDPGLSPKVKQAVKIAVEKIATQFSLEPL